MTDPLSALEQECAAYEAALDADVWDGPALPPWTPPGAQLTPVDRDRALALIARIDTCRRRLTAEREATAAELAAVPRRLAAASGYARHRA